ncbi:hypothetical protein BDR22DRAFT_886833 [Usnea florida]
MRISSPKYAATGMAVHMIANRLSWFYNLVGSSVNLDSACSSSLMAVDSAVESLRNGDFDMTLVAGGSVVLAWDLMTSSLEGGAGVEMNYAAKLTRAVSDDDAVAVVVGGLLQRLARALSIAVEDNDVAPDMSVVVIGSFASANPGRTFDGIHTSASQVRKVKVNANSSDYPLVIGLETWVPTVYVVDRTRR